MPEVAEGLYEVCTSKKFFFCSSATVVLILECELHCSQVEVKKKISEKEIDNMENQKTEFNSSRESEYLYRGYERLAGSRTMFRRITAITSLGLWMPDW